LKFYTPFFYFTREEIIIYIYYNIYNVFPQKSNPRFLIEIIETIEMRPFFKKNAVFLKKVGFS